MTSAKIKECSKCKTTLSCLVDDITNCDCSKITTDTVTLDFLKNTRYDCLCNACLSELNTLVKQSKTHRFPTNPDELKAGLHYYIENGYVVFTTFYHVLRGKCCQSGCRHCAYGFKNN